MIHSRDVTFVESERGWQDMPEESKQEQVVSISVPIDNNYLSNEQPDERSAISESTTMNMSNQESSDVNGMPQPVSLEESTSSGEAVESDSDEEEVQVVDDVQELHRYDLRDRTPKVKPAKYTMATKNSGDESRRASTLEELMFQCGPRWNDDR
jgi:hypothetical protein